MSTKDKIQVISVVGPAQGTQEAWAKPRHTFGFPKCIMSETFKDGGTRHAGRGETLAIASMHFLPSSRTYLTDRRQVEINDILKDLQGR